MPGKGCLLRKALRRAERATQDAGELGGDLRPNKIAKISAESFENLQAAKEAGLFQRPERIWSEVPPLKDMAKHDRQKAMTLCQAMYECVEENNNEPVSISNLGAHFKVQRVKKDPLFHNQRLLDIVQRHLDVFDLVQDGVTPNGWAIRIKDGIRVVNTDTAEEQNNFEAALLPERIEAPSNLEEACQAFRIECIIAIYKRGGKVQMNDIGQDKGVVAKRAAIGGNNRKLLDLFRAFPPNFALEDLGNGNYNVELLSTEVGDTSMLQSLALMSHSTGHKKKESSDVIAAEPGSKRELLINGVKDWQRTALNNKLKWYQFCDLNGSTSYDPGRHPDEFLEEFLTAAQADALPEPDDDLVAEMARKGAERAEKGKGKGKGGKSKSVGMGGAWVPGPAASGGGSKKGGKPSSSWGGASSWGDDWDWWGDSSFQEAMQAFMMWWGKGKGKGKGKDEQKGGPRVVPKPGGKSDMGKGACKGGTSGGPWRSPIQTAMGGGLWG